MNKSNVILKVENLKQHFPIGHHQVIKAVNGVSFEIYEGEVFSLVGESGSGKSTLGRSIIRLYTPTEGKVTFKGKIVSGTLNKATKKMLRNKMQMIFQDPLSSLNPRKKILDIVAQGLDVNHLCENKTIRRDKVLNILKEVGMLEDHINRYPHQFSGGQRQRIGIARALVLEPEFIIADEPISALDVSIQAQVINLMKQIQKERNITYLFIAHDLSMVKYLSDRIGVMHLGHLVELGTVDDIYNNPIHPYTKSLLSAIPTPNPILEKKRKRIFYDKSKIDYELGEWNQISDTHYCLATLDELKEWQNNDIKVF